MTPQTLAKMIYDSYLLHCRDYDPRLYPLGLYPFEVLPAKSHELLVEVATDIIRELNRPT